MKMIVRRVIVSAITVLFCCAFFKVVSADDAAAGMKPVTVSFRAPETRSYGNTPEIRCVEIKLVSDADPEAQDDEWYEEDSAYGQEYAAPSAREAESADEEEVVYTDDGYGNEPVWEEEWDLPGSWDEEEYAYTSDADLKYEEDIADDGMAGENPDDFEISLEDLLEMEGSGSRAE